MRFMILIITVLILFTLLTQCDKILSERVMPQNYTPVSIGDVTQLILMPDSSTIKFSITGQTKRKDGLNVFQGEWKYGTLNPLTFHYYLSDGYFIATELDTFSNDSILAAVNPFREQRLAMSYPRGGDTWLHTMGDPDSSYWVTTVADPFPTLFGDIEDVHGFDLYLWKDDVSPSLTTFYGPGLGWIGSSWYSGQGVSRVTCSYKKISGNTYGELWPEKDSVRLKKFSSYDFLKHTFDSGFCNVNGEI
jgi:hypothetical protein